MAKGPGLYSDIGKKARGTLSNCVEILNYDFFGGVEFFPTVKS